jgi:hypothetical protein
VANRIYNSRIKEARLKERSTVSSQQSFTPHWDNKVPPQHRQAMINKATTNPAQLDPETLKGVRAFPFPVTLVAVSSSGKEIAVFQQDAPGTGVLHFPVCVIDSVVISYPISLYLASKTAPSFVLRAEIPINSSAIINYRI